MTGSFWHARAYATDGGGEVIRLTLKDAMAFETICANDEKRLEAIAYRKEGLERSPGHRPTLKVVEALENRELLQALYNQVRTARRAIENVVNGGFPVVYAIRVEPQWFGDKWETYLVNWEEGHRAAVELRCARDLISPDRILAKAMYPKGTDSDFLADWCETWADVEALSRK